MTDWIYWETEQGLVELPEFDYSTESEGVLQDYVTEYPHLLCGAQMTPENPREWLFIEQESPIPDTGESSGRWSVDHLFIDQDGMPTMVEVKRAVDTRIRRKVVGQMLDYVSNATSYWSDEYLREKFEEDCEATGDDPIEVLQEKFGDDLDPEEYWTDVAQNIRLGNFRMVFLADKIPSELKRIVEYLNEHINSAEVLAVEVKQYTSDNGIESEKTVFAPRLFGQTERSRAGKSSSSSTSRTGEGYVETEDEFFADLEQKLANGKMSKELYDTYLELYHFADEVGEARIKSAKNASFGLYVPEHQGNYQSTPSVFTANAGGKLKVWTASMPLPDNNDEPTPVAWTKEDFQHYAEQFKTLDGVDDKRAPIDVLIRGDNLTRFQSIVREFVDRCIEAERTRKDDPNS